MLSNIANSRWQSWKERMWINLFVSSPIYIPKVFSLKQRENNKVWLPHPRSKLLALEHCFVDWLQVMHRNVLCWIMRRNNWIKPSMRSGYQKNEQPCLFPSLNCLCHVPFHFVYILFSRINDDQIKHYH